MLRETLLLGCKLPLCFLFFSSFLKSCSGRRDMYDQRLYDQSKYRCLCPMCFKTVTFFTNMLNTLLFVFREGSIRAFVNNIFQNTNLTDETVRDIVEAAINESTSGLLGNVTYDGKFSLLIRFQWPQPEPSSAEGFSNWNPTCFVPATDLCQQVPVPCEAATTNCNSSRGLATCSCLAGFVPSTYSLSSCKGKTTHHLEVSPF